MSPPDPSTTLDFSRTRLSQRSGRRGVDALSSQPCKHTLLGRRVTNSTGSKLAVRVIHRTRDTDRHRPATEEPGRGRTRDDCRSDLQRKRESGRGGLERKRTTETPMSPPDPSTTLDFSRTRLSQRSGRRGVDALSSQPCKHTLLGRRVTNSTGSKLAVRVIHRTRDTDRHRPATEEPGRGRTHTHP